MISCGVVNVILLILLVFSLKEAFFIKSIKKWTIHEYTGKNNEKIKKKEEKKNLEKPLNKNKILKFKSQSVNNLLFQSLFKLTLTKQEISTSKHFEVSTKIVKINLKKSKSCSLPKKIEGKNKNFCSTEFLFKNEIERKKLEILHIKKNNFFKGLNELNNNTIKKNEPEKTLELIQYFNREPENNNILQNYLMDFKEDDCQDILSFKNIEEPNKMLNNKFIGKMSKNFKSFCGEGDKFLDVIMSFKSKNI